MPVYDPLLVTPTRGLNLGDREDNIRIGESTVANNVDHSGGTLAKRKGYRNALTGTLDAAYKGGAPAQSLALVPEEPWLTPPAERGEARIEPNTAPPSAGEQNGRRDFFNQRPSFIVIPEGGLTGIRLDVQSGDPDWAIEFCFVAEQLPVVHSNFVSTASVLMKPIVAQKGFGVNGQWAVRLIPDATSTDRFYATLTLYEGGALGDGAGAPLGNDFFYSSGSDRAWIEPGKRVWVAWRFNNGTNAITSYYRIEGQTSSVNSSQDINDAGGPLDSLRTNGVGTGTYPITVGRRPYPGAGRFGIAAGGAANTRTIDEMGFTGSVTEMRFWLESAQGVAGTLELPANFGTVTTAPPASSDWYVESEIPDEQLTTNSSIEASNLVQTSDLQLYYQFKPELIGANADGTTNAGENHRFIRPRFTRGTATDNLAWVTGADATWIPGTGALGTYALGLMPAGPSAAKYDYANVMRSGDLNSIYGQRLFVGGLRVPNADRYIRKATTSGTGYEFPDEFTVRVAFRCDALPATGSGYQETIAEMCVVRRGANPNEDRYSTNAIMRIVIVESGTPGDWIIRFLMANAAGTGTPVDSTTTITEGQTYVIEAAVKYDGTNRFMAIFVDGAREATASGAATKPWMSQTTGVDGTSPNTDTDDGRDGLFPFHFGYSVITETALTPTTWLFRCGAWFPIATLGIGREGSARPYWAWNTDDCKKSPNDGIGYRGHDPLVGAIGAIQVWHRYLGESEARELATRNPTAEEMQADGSKLLSSWEFEEGQGCVAYDKGPLKNHLRINPYPTALIASGVLERRAKPPILGIWQRRQLSTSGSTVQQVYALTPGMIHKVETDGSGNKYLRPLGKCQTPEMFDPANVSYRLPTAFQFGPAIYVCTGLGAVKRIINDKVSDAGITPFYGDIGDDQTNLGWREYDRDGTFSPCAMADAGSPATAIFEYDKKFGYIVTPYDSETGIEGVPSRPMFLVARDLAGTTNGLTLIELNSLPRPTQRQVSHYRAYRTTANGGVFKFLRELAIDQATAAFNTSFVDNITDLKLGSEIDGKTWLSFPPPMNARIGMAFGARALYFGVQERPDTLFYSFLGQPGACPKEYQIQIASGQSTELVGGVVINGRCVVFTRTAAYNLYDAGGDISVNSQDLPPLQLQPLRDDLGCISHHGIVTIEGVGAIIPTERGPYLFDGTTFTDIGRLPKSQTSRIEPFWKTLAMSNSRNFVGVPFRRKKQWLFYCSTTSSANALNDRALVWDWAHNSYVYQTNRDIACASVIADPTTGLERVWCGTYTGDIFEFDPSDLDVNADGVVAAPYSGTIQDRKLDAHGSSRYSRLKLVTNSSLPTAGDGLRGVNLYVTNAGTPWHTVPLKILYNDANWVYVKAGDANTTSPTGFEWRLGGIAADDTSGKILLQSDSLKSRLIRVQLNLTPSTGTTLYATVGYDDQATTLKTCDPTKGIIPLAGFLGRGKRVQVRLHDSTLYGGLPNNPWECGSYELQRQRRGKSSYTASVS